jgi:hypothetical protein
MNRLKRKIAIRAFVLALAAGALAGCIVAPYPGYYHPHYYRPYY